jgi:hypothetical protein
MPTTAPLGLNARGPDVKSLQASLGKLGYKIPQHEIDDQLFGSGTQGALLKLQRKRRLRATGILDDATRGALDKAVADAETPQYRVEGRIFADYGAPAGGLLIRAYHRGFGGAEVKLGEGRTDDQGIYAIPYNPGDQTVNLEIRAVDAQGKETPLSATKTNAEKREVLNLVAPSSLKPPDPEYQRLTADLTKQLGSLDKLAQATEGVKRQDVTLLHRTTGWDARLIALAATAVKLAPETKVPANVLYAAFRTGLPTGKAELASVGVDALEKALSKARETGIVNLTDQEVVAAKAAFQTFAQAARRTMRAPGAPSSFGELLAKSGLDGGQQAAFQELYFAHRGGGADLWKVAAERGIPAAKIEGLRVQGKLACLTHNNADLTGSLQREIASRGDLTKLVTLDLYQADAWKARLKAVAGNDQQTLQELIPPMYTHESAADRLEAYAADLARKVRLSFPTLIVNRMIEKDELRLGADHDALKAPVNRFLTRARPLGFQLGRTPLGAFIVKNRDALFPRNTPQAEIDAATQGAKRVQRLYQITPTDDALKVLASLGFKTAQDVLAFPYDVFLERFGDKFDLRNKEASRAVAQLVYRKAQQVGAVTLNFFTGARQLETAPPVYALSPSTAERERAKNELIKQYPTMESLFGSLDFCECEHCRSVLSPAAYLVDLLQFLEPEELVWNTFMSDWKAKHDNASYPFKTQAAWNTFLTEWRATHPGRPDSDAEKEVQQKPYDRLIERRPDLPQLPLTCENTHTALPYIDVVNEILEYYVAHGALAADAARDTGRATTPDLLAEPQNVLPDAYETLNKARYPLSLPFDLWLETVRRFFEQFETPLDQVLEVFRQAEELYSPTPPPPDVKPYYRAAVFREQLGLSPAEYELFTDAGTVARWYELYGYRNAALASAALQSAKSLARRLGITYKQLDEVVRTGFVNPRLDALVVLEKLDVDAEDLFRYKGQAGFPALSADEKAAFDSRITNLATTLNLPVADVERQFDTAWQNGQVDEILMLRDADAGCNFERTKLQYGNGNAADALALLKINLFVRLWRKLGWTIEETDQALKVFLLPNIPPASDPAFSKKLGDAWKTALFYLAHLRALDDRVKAGKNGRVKLLSLWANLATTGKDPLYAQLFLTPSILKNDPVFDNPVGNYLTKAGIVVRDHMLALEGALSLTADDIERILHHVGSTVEAAALSLDNVSLLYRHGLLAKALKLSVRDLGALKGLSGRDPFTKLKHGPVAVLAEDYPFEQTLGFVEAARRVKDSGFTVADVEYLLRHRFDPVGKYRPNPDALVMLVTALAAGVRQVLAEQVVPEQPEALTDDLLREKLALVFPPDVVEVFLGFWNDTIEFSAAKDSVPEAQKLSPATYEVRRVRVVYDAVRQRQCVVHSGVLTDTEKTEILKNVPVPKATAPPDEKAAYANFNALLDSIAAQSQPKPKEFFDQYLAGFLASPYDDLYGAGVPSVPARRRKLLEAILQVVRRRLIHDFAVRTLATSVGADVPLAEALLVDVLKDPNRPADPLLAAFTTVGISAEFFGDGNASLGTAIMGSPDTSSKPAGAKSVRFEGLFEIPVDGAYRFFAAFDKKDAEATFAIPTVKDPVLEAKAARDADEQSEFLELKRGVQYPFSLEFRKLGAGDARLLIQGGNLPKGTMGRLALYPKAAPERVGRAYVLLAKVLQLIQGLALSEPELRYLTAHAADFGNLDLSKLPTREADDSDTAAKALFGHFSRLAEYARLKRDLAGGTNDLLSVFGNARRTYPNAANEAEAKRAHFDPVAQLTRREADTVAAVAARLGFSVTVAPAAPTGFRVETPHLLNEEGLARLWDALQLVERLGAPVAALDRWIKVVADGTPPTERVGIARDLRNTVKARYDAEDWRRIAQPVFDLLRQRQRDALVAFIMHRNGFERLEELFEFFLIDPGMEPVVQTSRLRLALSSVQLFIQRCLLNLERWVDPSAINSQHWQWMKRYRVWEANRKIFLFPENWLEPEFRDDKTHLFQEVEGALLQGDVSNDLVEDAFFNYLKKLDALARLDIVTLYCEEKPDPASNTLHVIGRTHSLPHEYFYRRYAFGMWTPWEPVTAEIESDHVVAVMWRERLHLFWLTFLEKAEERVDEDRKLEDMGSEKVGDVRPLRRVEIQLNWCEYFQGEWRTRESTGFGAPVSATVPLDFDSADVFIHVTLEVVGGAAVVRIHLGYPFNQAFEVVSKNSPPEIVTAEAPPELPYVVTGPAATRYTGEGSLSMNFVEKILTDDAGHITLTEGSKTILGTVDDFMLVPSANPLSLVPMTAAPVLEGTTPLYRLYSPGTGDHFYTTSAIERDDAIATYGYQDEGTACHVFSRQAADTTPLYRLLKPASSDHFYTTSAAERDNAIRSYGYQTEGTACFVYAAAVDGSTPLYRLLSDSTGDHFYTTNPSERDYAIAHYNYRNENVACHVLPARRPSTAIAPLIAPFFYQDKQHAFYVEPTLTETTVEQWEEWVISVPRAEPRFERDDWWREIPIFTEVPALDPPPPIDPVALFGFGLKGDWLTNPRTALQFGERLVGRNGGLAFAVLPADRRAGGRGGLLTVGGGSELPVGTVLAPAGAPVTNGRQAPAPAGSVNVIGQRGLNALVLSNMRTPRGAAAYSLDVRRLDRRRPEPVNP